MCLPHPATVWLVTRTPNQIEYKDELNQSSFGETLHHRQEGNPTARSVSVLPYLG